MADPKKINQLDNELAPSGDNYMSSTRPGSGVSYKWRFSQHFTWVLGQLKASIIANDSNVSGASIADALNAINVIIGALNSDNVGNVSDVTGTTVTAALNTLKSLVETNTFNISQLSLDLDELTDLVATLFTYPLWTVIPDTSYTATPASVNTITTSVDQSAALQIGDVIKVDLTGIGIVYCKVMAVTPTLITVFGDLLTADIISIRYETGNAAAIARYTCKVGSDELYLFGDNRPAVRETNSGTLTVPDNKYGTDIYYPDRLRVKKGTLVYARATANTLDSSVTGASLEMSFDGVNPVTSWDITGLSVDSNAIAADYASTDVNYAVVNVTNPSGNKKVEGIVLYFEMFNDKDPS